MNESAFLYRYQESIAESGCVTLKRIKFRVLSLTPRGYWIFNNWENKKRWVSRYSHKTYALPTIEQALTSYLARKKRQIKILESQLAIAKAGQQLAQNNPTGKTYAFPDSSVFA